MAPLPARFFPVALLLRLLPLLLLPLCADAAVVAFTGGNYTGWETWDWGAMTHLGFWTQPPPEVAARARQEGVRLFVDAGLPGQDQWTNASARDAFASLMAGKVKEHGTDGVFFDFEGSSLSKDQKSGYALLAGAVSQALKPLNATLFVCVGGRPTYEHRDYPYVDLAAAAEFLFIMGYDMHFWDDYTCVLKGTCSPAEAPIKDVQLGVSEYMQHGVSPEKLVLGLPWYGQRYDNIIVPINYGQISYSTVLRALDTPGLVTKKSLDSDSQSWVIHCNPRCDVDEAGEKGNVVWFDDATTLAPKYKVARDAKLLGVGMWEVSKLPVPSASGEDPHKKEREAMWAAIAQWQAPDSDSGNPEAPPRAASVSASAFPAATAAVATTSPPAIPPPVWNPSWPVTYATKDATFAFVDVNTSSAAFGAIVYGWAFAKTTETPQNAHELEKIIQQCGRNKMANPEQRCMTYLNTELCLGWYAEQNAVFQNASLAQELLILAANGSVIHVDNGPTMIQAFWDFRKPAAVSYYEQHLLGPVVAADAMDGVLFDDVAGFPNEHPGVAEAFCGPSFDPKTKTCAAIAEVKAATHVAIARFTRTLALQNKFSFIYEFGSSAGMSQNLSRFLFLPSPDGDHGAAACAQATRDALLVGTQQKPFVMTATSFNSTFHGNVTDPWLELRLAAFLVARGKYAYFGSSDVYDGSEVPNIAYPALRADYGTPLADGRETRPGVFAREWSEVSVEVDCNTLTGNIRRRSLRHDEVQ